MKKRTNGLILLVVLSMLTLFSMLAITYVVFSSQARSSSMGMARGDHRGTPPQKLLDEAIHQVVRGTTDERSALWKHSLLGDLYGTAVGLNDDSILLAARTVRRDNPYRNNLGTVNWLITTALPPTAGALEAPQIFGDSFLSIPLEWNEAIPEQHDVWNGRIVTFTSGPLRNHSFRIVKYIGEVPSAPTSPPPNIQYEQSLQYSIVIDLSELRDKVVTSGTTTAQLSSFLASSTAAYDLIYNDSTTPTTGYGMVLNAAPMNSYGSGIALNGALQTAASSAEISFLAGATAPVNQLPTNFQAIATTLLPNYSHTRIGNPTFTPTGDTDESYDAADFANFFLSFRFPGGTSSEDIIPSFHRPALINYVYSQIISVRALSAFTPQDLFGTIELLQRASGRPLSFTVSELGNTPYANAPFNGTVSQHPNFNGSNNGDYPLRAPELDIDWSEWSNGTVEHQKFEAWVRWLQRGPWDVDNDGDGINDSMWTDINMPLMTSADGKLLKLMAAFYIEDLSGRLNLNANGSVAQAIDADYIFATDNRFSYNHASYLPQGLGYGPADTSLRHLFDSSANYLRFISERHGAPEGTAAGNLLNFGPGANVAEDAQSQLRSRHKLAFHSQLQLPGFPLSVFSHSGLGLDLFGNPYIYDSTPINQIIDDPYELRLQKPYRDTLFSIAEWERLYRMNDWDRSTLPRRLENILTPTGTSAVDRVARTRAVTPLSSSTMAARLGGSYVYTRANPQGNNPLTVNVTRRVTSFMELVEAMAQQKAGIFGGTSTPYFSTAAFRELFPLEFRQNLPLDPNRPLGNGMDDNGNGLIDEQSELAGHGIDDDGMNGVDDLAEVTALPGRHQRAEYTSGAYNNILEQYVPGGGIFDPYFENAARTPYERRTFNGNQSRQMLARHLYCLAHLILPNDYVFPNTATAHPYGSIERARILAQWAVNVVDFRDADANMTRFDFDVNPFTPKPGGIWVPDDGTVWGQEQPELLLTESMAFHDLRLNRKQNPPPMTNTWQQLRIPEGSLFLELMCTRSDGNNILLPGVPRGNLYATPVAQPVLNVAAITPADDAGVRFPVWRVLLTDPHEATQSVHSRYGAPATRSTMQYQLASQAGLPWSTAPTPPATPNINRMVWFTDLVPVPENIALPSVTTMTPAKVYRKRNAGGVYLEGGQYLVVGPRQETFLGQRDTGASPRRNQPNPHRILLQSNWTQMWSENNRPSLWLGPTRPLPLPNMETVPAASNFLKGCVTLVTAADPPTGWTSTQPIGISISEPTPDNSYYPEPLDRLNTNDNGTDMGVTNAAGFATLPPDAYVNLVSSATGNSSQANPLDLDPARPLGEKPPGDFQWGVTAAPGPDDQRPLVQTRLDWSTAILQRLAIPEQPWHAVLNPYITVDWMPIDLTVFNGEHTIAPDSQLRLASRQKSGLYAGDLTEDVTAVPTANLPDRAGRTFYSYHTEESPNAIAATSTAEPAFLRYQFALEYADRPNDNTDVSVPRLTAGRNVAQFATLGYLNSRFGLRGMGRDGNGTSPEPMPTGSHDYLGAPVYYSGTNIMAPTAPFWANRDFVNSYELMNVPLSSPGQFMQEFTALPGAPGEVLFKHTLDFDMTAGANAGLPVRPASLLFELIGTRSPWIESETIVDPANTISTAATPTAADYFKNFALDIYRAPFNRLPHFVEPGRVNMNTAAEGSVFRGLMWAAMTPAPLLPTPGNRNSGTIPFQTQFATSRSNLSPSSALPNPNPRLDRNQPTEFNGIIRSGFEVDKGPLGVSQNNSATASILRPGTTGRLFNANGLFLGTVSNLPHNTFTTNYPVTRLANLTTDRSDTYAVRITLGFFEYDPVTGLGAEYGKDNGTSQRHRGFFVVDRSIPVGFIEGQDLNTKNCILLRRYVE